jgi:putative ABC transport system ATP-binding protein
LDETNTEAIIALFQKIAHEQHKCVIIVTHEANVAAACDQTLKLSNGEFEWVTQPA